jgi:hypothetical protein
MLVGGQLIWSSLNGTERRADQVTPPALLTRQLHRFFSR